MGSLFATLSPSVAANWVDGILFCILLFYIVEGLISGVVYASFDFIKFVASFISGLLFYGAVGSLLILLFHMPKGYANAIGFFTAAFVTEVFLHVALRKIVKNINKILLTSATFWGKLSNFLGVFPGLLSGSILVMFVVTVLMALPASPFLKHAIGDSHLGSFFVARSEGLQKNLASIFGGAAEETLNFLTVEPQSNTSVSLGFTTKGQVDSAAEQEMLRLVNIERASRGIPPLAMDDSLQSLARGYADFMLEKGYFSHYTPDGLSPFDRMNASHIVYIYAGENLAFSANVQLAMQGLMNSPGHRDNILSSNYHKVGIGVMDAGIYGEMFVQEFTD